jgi:hypothetical protein
MKKIIYNLILFSLVSSSAVRGEFNDLGCGARAIGMGNAFVALADDVNSIYYNPAGLVRLRKNEFTSSYGRLYLGLDDGSNLGWGYIGYGQPLGQNGTAGLGYNNFSLVNGYVENTIILSYGKWLTKRLAVGVNLKYLRQKIYQDAYTRKDPVFNYGRKDSVANVSFDTGYIFNLTKNLSLGMAFYDINQPDMGFKQKSKLHRMYKTGFAYRNGKIKAAIDVSLKNKKLKIYTGGERLFFHEILALRTGLGIGSNEYKNFTLGLGFCFDDITLDYSFLFPMYGISDINGSHRISLIIRFGVWPAKFKPEIELEPKDVIIMKLKEDAEKLKIEHEKEKYRIILNHKELIHSLLNRVDTTAKDTDKKVEVAVKKYRKRINNLENTLNEERQINALIESSHLVKKGETLKGIAEKYYGDRSKWKLIYEENKEIINKGKLKAGMILKLPEKFIRK